MFLNLLFLLHFPPGLLINPSFPVSFALEIGRPYYAFIAANASVRFLEYYQAAVTGPSSALEGLLDVF